MNTRNFDEFTRTASRRGSLLALGGVGLTALAGSMGAAAKPKPGKVAKKKVKAKCKAQVGQCAMVFNKICETSVNSDDCKLALLPCCDFLSTCNAGAMAQCLETVVI